jgi:hypothetical protein
MLTGAYAAFLASSISCVACWFLSLRPGGSRGGIVGSSGWFIPLWKPPAHGGGRCVFGGGLESGRLPAHFSVARHSGKGGAPCSYFGVSRDLRPTSWWLRPETISPSSQSLQRTATRKYQPCFAWISVQYVLPVQREKGQLRAGRR